MAAAKMSVAELEKFLREEFPQAFSDGDITIESADGETCLLRRRYDERMLRPGGTVSGPTPCRPDAACSRCSAAAAGRSRHRRFRW